MKTYHLTFDIPVGTELTEVGFGGGGYPVTTVLFKKPITIKTDEVLRYYPKTGKVKIVKRK